MPEKKIVIGLINSNAEILEVLSLAFQMEGFKTVTAHLQTFKENPKKYTQFLKRHKPKVLVIDVPPPYEENWGYAKKMKDTEITKTIGFVFTSTNKQRLEELVGKTEVIELIGKPYDLIEIVQAASRTYQVTHIARKLKPLGKTLRETTASIEETQ